MLCCCWNWHKFIAQQLDFGMCQHGVRLIYQLLIVLCSICKSFSCHTSLHKQHWGGKPSVGELKGIVLWGGSSHQKRLGNIFQPGVLQGHSNPPQQWQLHLSCVSVCSLGSSCCFCKTFTSHPHDSGMEKSAASSCSQNDHCRVFLLFKSCSTS